MLRSMKQQAISTGINFGLTSGVITTSGLIAGLHSGTNSMLAVVGRILTIAIADSMSDALGIHISKESDPNSSKKDVWVATIVTLITKMCMSLTFIVPVLFLALTQTIIVSVIWGLSIIAILSYSLAKKGGKKPIYVVGEHLFIAIVVIVMTHYIGDWVAISFG